MLSGGNTAAPARDFVHPTGAHDIYHAGEYAIYNQHLYKCTQDTCTGFIPISDGSAAHIYRIAGDGVSFSKTDEYDRIAWYDASFTLLKNVLPAKRIDSSTYYPTTIAESTTAMTFKVTDSSGAVVSNVPASAAYFRVGATGSGANLIVTLDEEIK